MSFNTDEIKSRTNATIYEWAYKALLMLVMSGGGYVATQVWASQKDLAEKMETRIRTLENFQAETAANRYSAKDHQAYALQRDAITSGLDRRIFEVEVGLKGINKSLERIEDRLGTKQ